MKKAIILLLFMTGIVVKNTAQVANEAFDAYFKATGGIELWKQVKTYSIKQSYVSNAASDYDMVIKASIPDASMLKTKVIMQRNFIYGVSPTDAFYKIPTGSRDKAVIYQVRDLSEKEKLNMKREVLDIFAPFFNYPAKGYIATFVGLETIGGEITQHVELGGKDIKFNLYFSQATGLLKKMTEKLSTGEIITREFTTYATSEFGIKYPSAGTYYSSIDKRNVKLTTEIVYNAPFEANTFKR
jgi:hypothetical protein